MSTDQPLNLLALDGGGVKGVSELVILDRIMRKVQELNDLDELPKPCEYFDLIAGTSTGGLIAVMLGRLRMSTAEAITAFDDLAKVIFSDKNHSKVALLRRGARYRTHVLRQAIEDLVSGREMGESMLGPDDQERGRMFVCARATNTKNGVYRRFRSYKASGDDDWGEDCKIWEAARATSAAPSYFGAVEISSKGETETYVDAGLGCNNPLNELLSEAADLFGKDRRIGCILSLGTGTKSLPTDLAQPSGVIGTVGWIIKVVKVMKELALDTEKDSYEVKERLRLFDNTMFRLNVEGGANNIDLASYSKIAELKARTVEYLSQSAIREDIKTVAEILAGHKMGHGLTVGHVCFLDKDQVIMAEGSANLGLVPTPTFIGRERFLGLLAAYFTPRDPEVDKITRRQYLLYGMGGAGKSQIARQFVQSYRDRFKYTFWIDATNRVTIQESYHAIAQSILPSGDAKSASMQDVLRWFSNSKDEWFLVVDNWSKEISQRNLPEVQRGNCLFTSREASVSGLLPNCSAQVAEMEEDDAVTLLLRAAGEDDDYNEHRKAAKPIVLELGHLPLAIDQAGAYIRKSGIPLARYLGIFRAQRTGMLSLPQFKGTSDNDLPVYATFDLSYKKLIELSKKSRASSQALEARSALQVLNVVCFYHNEGLTKDIFRRAAADRSEGKHAPYFPLPGNRDSPAALVHADRGGNWDPQPATLGFELLEKMSLLKKTARDVWSMHILTHSWARDRMDPTTKVRQALSARALLFDSCRRGDGSEDVIHRRAILAHLDACTRILPLERLPERSLENCVASCPRKDWDAVPNAVEYFDHPPQESPTLDPDLLRHALPWDNDTIESEYHFRYALVFREHRMLAKFEEELLQALRGKQRAFGTLAGESLDILDFLPGLEWDKGNIWGSAALRIELVVRSEREPGGGPRHPRTIQAIRDLANQYALHSCYEEAKECHQAIQEAEETNSSDSRWVSASNEEAAAALNMYQRADDSQAREQMLQASVQLWEAGKLVFGEDDPKTLKAMASVAGDLSLTGKPLESARMFWKVFQARKKIYGLDNVTTLETLQQFVGSVGKYYHTVRAPQEAFDELATASAALYRHCSDSRGSYHPVTINTLGSFSVALHRQGDMQRAHETMKSVVERSIAVWGTSHPMTEQARKDADLFGEDLDITVEVMRHAREVVASGAASHDMGEEVQYLTQMLATY